MPKPLAEGDRVRVSDREPVPADVKSQLFYEHYRGVTGVIAKLYADGTAAVNVDTDALSKDIARRHIDTSDALRHRWLDAISDEQRNKLSSAEKSFALRYTILLAATDLQLESDAPKPAASSVKQPAAKVAETAAPEPARKTLAEIEAEEAKHFEEIQRQAKS
jgi:hypothetical protein